VILHFFPNTISAAQWHNHGSPSSPLSRHILKNCYFLLFFSNSLPPLVCCKQATRPAAHSGSGRWNFPQPSTLASMMVAFIVGIAKGSDGRMCLGVGYFQRHNDTSQDHSLSRQQRWVRMVGKYHGIRALELITSFEKIGKKILNNFRHWGATTPRLEVTTKVETAKALNLFR